MDGKRSSGGSAARRRWADYGPAQETILLALERHGDLSRGELQQLTGLTRSTLGRHLGILLRRGEVVELPPAHTGSPGRPAELLTLSGRTGVLLVQLLSLGTGAADGPSVCAVVDGRGTVLAGRALGPSKQPHHDGVRMLRKLLHEAGTTKYEVRAAVLSTPYPLVLRDARTHQAVTADAELPGVAAQVLGARPQRVFEKAFGVPALLANDSDLGALGELQVSADSGVQDLVYIKVLAGLSAGIVAAGRLATFGGTTAGDLDHLHPLPAPPQHRPLWPVVDPADLTNPAEAADNAAPCPLSRRFQQRGYDSVEEVRTAVVLGDAAALEDMRLIGSGIGRWLAGLQGMYRPQVVALEAALGPLHGPLAEGVAIGMRFAAPAATAPTQVRESLAGAHAELIGAAVAARGILLGRGVPS